MKRIVKTEYFGRTICDSSCPAYFTCDGDPECSARLRSYPDKWDGVTGKYIPLCRIPKEFHLAQDYHLIDFFRFGDYNEDNIVDRLIICAENDYYWFEPKDL